LTFQKIDSRIDKSIYTYPVGCSHKGKDNMIEETSYIESLNDIECPHTANKYYSKKHRKYVPVVFMHTFASIDQIGKKSCTSHAGDNSDYRPKFGYSCSFKDIAYVLP